MNDHMLPIDTKKFGIIHPIQFTSPLPITECRNRLQHSLGKAMGSLFTTIEGEVEMVDTTTCKFRLYQDVSNGGRRTIVGFLYAQTNSSTLVDAVFGIERQSLWIFILILVAILITTLLVQQIACALVIALFIVPIVYRSGLLPARPPREFKKEPMSQLVWWFKRTLKQ